MKVSDYIIKYLKDSGIEKIFTISGGGCIHLIDSLVTQNMEYICMHHEQSCAMASEGYNRMSNSLKSAVLVTTGPGGTNALTGVLGAWLDSIPMIIISGQVALNQTIQNTGCRQIGDQEYNIIDSVKSMTKYAKMITEKDSILSELPKVLDIAISGRPGPVWLDIPLNIQGADIDVSKSKIKLVHKKNKIDNKTINTIIDKLNKSKNPLIVLGNGVRFNENVQNQLNELLKITQIPVMTTVHSNIDIVNESYPHYVGRFGLLGQMSSNSIIQKCDLLISIGSRLSIKSTGFNYELFAKNAYKIMVDIDENELSKFTLNIDLKVNTTVETFLSAILNKQKNINLTISNWQQHCKWTRYCEIFVYPKHRLLKKYVSNYCFIEALSNSKECIYPIVTSNGSAHVCTLQTIKLKDNQRLFTNVGCASMGYGLPAAIGACISNNDSVVCLEGDGSIQMNIQELQTVKHHNLPLKLFVINNDGYLSIKITQKTFFSGREVASGKESGISFPNMKQIAKSYGIKYVSIKNNKQLDRKIKKVMKYNKPIICEVFTYPKELHEPKVQAKGIDTYGNIIPGELTNQVIENLIYEE